MKLQILYEDQDIACINKPAGIVVNRAATVKEETVQDFWQARQGAQDFISDWQTLIPSDFQEDFGDPMAIWQERGGIVHRLDKDTSGVLLLAKNPGALLNLLAQFKQRQTQKVYQALVHGVPKLASGQIEASMARSRHNRLKFAIDQEGRPAVTSYQIKDIYPNLRTEMLDDLSLRAHLPRKKIGHVYQAGFALLELQPKTGRTHQLRVHMSAMQHPIVGDAIYAGKKRARLDSLWCKRQFLHAWQLTFTNPRSQVQQTVEAPLAGDLQQSLLALQH